jgi:methyl-accepting chemotaxis protein
MKQFKTLKGKLVFAGVMALLVTVVVNLGIGVFLSYQGMEKNVEKDLKSIGQTAQVAVTNSTNLMKEKIQFIGSSSEIGGTAASGKSWITSLENKKESYGYKMLYVADRNGKITSSNADYNGKSVESTEYFKQAMNGKITISTPMKDIAGNLAVFAAAPVSNQKYNGVVVGEMDAQTYSNIVSTSVVIGQTGNVFIIDKNGVMIANKRPQLVAQQQNFIEMAKSDSAYATSAAVYKKMIAGQSGVATYAYETGTRICYYQPLSGTDGWSCGAVAPLSEMMSEEYSIIIGMVLASIVLIALGVFLMSRLAQTVSSPIRACSERLLLLSQGDLHSDVPKFSTNDETGDLAKATAVLVSGLQEIVRDETFLLTSLAKGDFNVVSHCNKYAGDLKPLQTSIEKIVDSLNAAFRQISQSAEQVASGSDQVSGGAQLLAQGATEQAGSVEALSKSIKDLSSDITSNAESASSSNKKASQAKDELLEGNRQIEGLTKAMGEIKASSDKISKIIKTVENIAFQTNILALNAAVEAARAGEAGKGFSVVADEVRNLASKSAQASKETSGMIAEMVQAVKQGSEITNHTGKTMLSIVEDTKQIISSVSSISSASQQQSEAIQKITQSVDQISSVIQTNSATAEESAAASEELSSQASEMQNLVQQFRLRSETEETDRKQE